MLRRHHIVIAGCLCAGVLIGAHTALAHQTPLPAAAPAPAQPQATAQKPAAALTPAQLEQKLYNDALRIKDPQKRIDALQAALTGMSSRGVFDFMARRALLEALAKNFPARTDQIRAEAVKILESRQSAAACFVVAKTLLDSGTMLDYAEELARKGVALFDEESAADTARQRTKYLSALGLIYLKTGKSSEAEKVLAEVHANDARPAGAASGGLTKLLEDAVGEWSGNARQAAIAMALAEVAERKGDLKSAFDQLANAAMLAPITAADRKKLEDLYRRTHSNSADGLEEDLDARYRKLNPLQVQVEPYKAPAERSTRAALAELFTGSGCGPCVAVDLGFEAMLKRYSRQELIVLAYHQHIPQPDPMTNPAANARGKFYAVNSTPTFMIDGSKKTGGGERDQARAIYAGNYPAVDKLLSTPAGADVRLGASRDGGTVKVNVVVDQIRSESADLRLQIALVEDELSYTGENGIRIHPMVVRRLAGEDFSGFPLTAGKPLSIDYRFDLAAVSGELQAYIDGFVKNPPEKFVAEDINFSKPMHTLNRDNLSVVAFVQDEKTKQVLQASSVKVSPGSASTPKAEK